MAQKGRAVILMMDSFGIGGAEDAAKFGDSGDGHVKGVLKLGNQRNDGQRVQQMVVDQVILVFKVHPGLNVVQNF